MGQTLSTHIRQIKDAERVEVIATNPPFGGEEEEGILNNFPEGMRVKDTAVLFMQYVMARLKRRGGRCAIVVNNGYLSSSFHEKLYNRGSAHTTLLALGAPPRH